MRKRFAIAGAVVGLLALSAGLTLSTAFGSRDANTILIGISAAKTGILAPYDLQSGQLFQMRINQIDKAAITTKSKIAVPNPTMILRSVDTTCFTNHRNAGVSPAAADGLFGQRLLHKAQTKAREKKGRSHHTKPT